MTRLARWAGLTIPPELGPELGYTKSPGNRHVELSQGQKQHDYRSTRTPP
jgi:hypothetical protein